MKLFAIAALCATLTAPAAFASTPTTPIADVQRGTMVTVAGTVERITDEDEFRLTDASGSIQIYVGPNWVPAEVGESVVINGFLDDDFVFPREIYARSLTRADGTVITFDRQYD